jgi:hypothetical protein
MKTLSFKLHGNHMLLVHTKLPPSKEEWAAYMAEATIMDQSVNGDLTNAGILVFTDGGAPNTVQRTEINTWLHGRRIRTGVICASAFIRGVVTALNWLNKDIKAFAPHEWKEAMAHVGLADVEHTGVRADVTRLAADVGGCNTVSLAFAEQGNKRESA